MLLAAFMISRCGRIALAAHPSGLRNNTNRPMACLRALYYWTLMVDTPTVPLTAPLTHPSRTASIPSAVLEALLCWLLRLTPRITISCSLSSGHIRSANMMTMMLRRHRLSIHTTAGHERPQTLSLTLRLSTCTTATAMRVLHSSKPIARV